MIHKCHKGVDVRPAAPASRDNLIGNHGDRVRCVMESSVRLNDKRKGQFGFLEEGVGSWDGIEGGPHEFRRAVRGRRRDDTGLDAG